MGSTEPRLWTPPLRKLTPDTSVGFNQIRFAKDKLRRPPLPWQEFAMIHAGELMPDGRPRFRIVILEVARQNGKTEIVVILPAYWMFVDDSPLIVGTSTKLEYARETWVKTRKLIARSSALQGCYNPKRWYVNGAMDTSMWAHAYDDRGQIIPGEQGARYKIATANEEGGRSLTINKGIADELRQHHDWLAWDAMEPAASDWDSQIWATSNAGSDKSVVLNSLHDQAEQYILHGIGDPRVGLLSWSADQDADPEDPAAILQANPRVGYGGKTLEDLRVEAATAVREGGERLTGFKTEKLCIRVRVLNPAIDPGAWLRQREPGTLDAARKRLGACIDVAPDGGHVTLAVAGVLADGRVRGEIAGSWDSVVRARLELPGLLNRIRPVRLGWFPQGPAAVLAADLQERPGWPPPGMEVEPIRGDTPAACMGLEELVRSRAFVHSGDPLLDAQVSEAERLKRGAVWVFVRADPKPDARKEGKDGKDGEEGEQEKPKGHVDAVYAMAGAVWNARTLPPPVGDIRLVVVSDED